MPGYNVKTTTIGNKQTTSATFQRSLRHEPPTNVAAQITRASGKGRQITIIPIKILADRISTKIVILIKDPGDRIPTPN